MRRRFDPNRRDRIIDAAIDCIAADGVAGTSHRKVAAHADVPLGSMSYHFQSMDELLQEAFTRFTVAASATIAQRMDAATDTNAAVDQIVEHIHADLQQSARDHVLTYELYTLAARRPEFQRITQGWMRISRAVLEQHFPPDIARAVDAYIEGAALHIALDSEGPDPARTRADLRALSRALLRE